MRISTSLLALGCQSGPDATLETPIKARSKSTGSRSLRIDAAFDSPLYQPANRLMHLLVRGFEHFLRVTEERVERGCDELLRCDGIDE